MENTERLSIKYWKEEDRPREKLLAIGKQNLTEAELLAIIIGSGSKKETAVELSRRILNSTGNSLNELSRLSVKELIKKFKGIGEAKAISIVAAIELGSRRRIEDVPQKVQIKESNKIVEIFQPILGDLPHEEFWVLLLNRANKIITKKHISMGGISGTVADTRIIFKNAVENLASSVILCHNHPSGNKSPSQADIDLTKKLKKAGEVLDIPVLDHIIITQNDYFSFADEGMI